MLDGVEVDEPNSLVDFHTANNGTTAASAVARYMSAEPRRAQNANISARHQPRPRYDARSHRCSVLACVATGATTKNTSHAAANDGSDEMACAISSFTAPSTQHLCDGVAMNFHTGAGQGPGPAGSPAAR